MMEMGGQMEIGHGKVGQDFEGLRWRCRALTSTK